MSLSAADFLATVRLDEGVTMPKPEFTDRVLEFASEIVDYMIAEIQGGSDWYPRFDALSDMEKKALYKAIADGFNDSTEE